MATPADTVRSFYSAIAAGDVETSMSLMANDVEWVTVEVWPPSEDNDELTQLSAFIAQTLADRYGGGWAFKVGGRGLQEVAQHVLLPFVEEGSSFVPSSIEFLAEDDKVVWLGSLTRIDGPFGVRADVAYAHIWTIRDGKIARLRQFSYTPRIPEGRPN